MGDSTDDALADWETEDGRCSSPARARSVTAGKDLVYPPPDNFHDSIKNYLELTGQVEGGRKIASNTEASGRFHSDWLNMIHPRLKAARGLLRSDGVICFSIDDGEEANLRKP